MSGDLRYRPPAGGLLRRTLMASLAVAAAAPARAGQWPERPLTWIVPFPGGSSADRYARLVAEPVGKDLGQPVTVDNRTGAGGTLAASLFSRASSDGYTLLVGYTGLAYASVIYPKDAAGFDFGDFIPISALAREPFILVVNPARLDVGDLRQFLAAARSAPGTITMASDGQGTVSHLAIDLLLERADIDIKHVALRSSVDQLDALVAKRVDGAFLPPHAALKAMATGKLRLVAVAARRQEALFPGVPTFDEAGLDAFRVSQWFGLFAPKGTPQPVLDVLHTAVQAALETGPVTSAWAEQGARVEPEGRADFARFVREEISRWSRIAKAANFQLD